MSRTFIKNGYVFVYESDNRRVEAMSAARSGGGFELVTMANTVIDLQTGNVIKDSSGVVDDYPDSWIADIEKIRYDVVYDAIRQRLNPQDNPHLIDGGIR
jgi:hypothetical protein